MTIEYIRAVIEEIYYSGHIKVDKKLDDDDFLQLSRMAHGTILRNLFREQGRYQKAIEYYSGHVTDRDFEIQSSGSSRPYVELEEDMDIVKLPRGLGIFAVMPYEEKGCSCNGDFIRSIPGSDWLLCGRDFEGMKTFTPSGRRIYLKGAPDCMKKVTVLAIFSDEKMDVPIDIAFDIVNSVLASVLGKNQGFPVDKTDNQNPNVGLINQALTQTTQHEQ